ncbi:alpha/beta fold hydrolase [Pseudonocardia benzenivorans]|uniref:Alpha/beta fold hydrolase n=1 Tax=Pseudonocardia benzenivorans TaxID=228005 RepID=A0ABW3VAP1_9PSEU
MTDPAGSAGRAAARARDPGSFAGCWDAISRLDVAAGLAALDLPVLALARDADISLPPDAAETLARTGRDTTTVTVAGGWHLGAYEHPEPYRDAIEAFLATLPTHPSGTVLG